MPGGFVGVDIFFVISGYLITAHLLKQAQARGRIDFVEFWARRIRRLLPASYLVLLVTLVTIRFAVPSAIWRDSFEQIRAAAAYVLNWLLGLHAVDYLAAEDVPTAAQHYWSLSAEEQFYAVWPIIIGLAMWTAQRRGRGLQT